MTYFKIVKVKEDGLYTLYHGYPGKSKRLKRLQFGKWLKAEVKLVRDGSNSRYYESGFHVLPSYEEAKDYKKKFKQKGLGIIPVECKNVRPKPNSVSYLAEEIKISMDVFYKFITR